MKENQINRIDHFLKFISEISKSGIQIDSNLVYANLVKLGSKGSRFDDYFTAWIQRFKTNKNINVFVDDNWNCFCQFKSIYDDKNLYYKLKLYIPMDKEHIYKGVNDLFDFLSHQNIQHLSKVSINERFDDVVIRVNNVRCAKEIMKYVNQNDYIKQGLIAPNPFAFTDGNISLVWDGMMSYNSVISNWISLYINQCKINNCLDNVSYIDFYTYVYNMYNKIFIEGKDINNFLNSLKLNGGIKELTNYQYVTRILLISLNKNSTLDDLFNEFNKIVIPINQKNTENKMNYFIENDKKQDILIDNTQEESFNLLLFELSKNSGIENAILCIKRILPISVICPPRFQCARNRETKSPIPLYQSFTLLASVLPKLPRRKSPPPVSLSFFLIIFSNFTAHCKISVKKGNFFLFRLFVKIPLPRTRFS